MTGLDGITDDQWEALARKRQSHFDGSALPPGSHAEYIAALDAILALRPERVRPWQPGDQWALPAGHPSVDPRFVTEIEQDGSRLCVTWRDGKWDPQPRWWVTAALVHCPEPESWVAAGRPGVTSDLESMTQDRNRYRALAQQMLKEDPYRWPAPVGEATEDLSDGPTDYTDPRTIDVGVVRGEIDQAFKARGHTWTDRLSWPNVTVKALADRITQLESRPVGEATTEPEPLEWIDDRTYITPEPALNDVSEDSQPSAPSVEDIAEQLWDQHCYDDCDMHEHDRRKFNATVADVVGPVLDRLTAAEAALAEKDEKFAVANRSNISAFQRIAELEAAADNIEWRENAWQNPHPGAYADIFIGSSPPGRSGRWVKGRAAFLADGEGEA